MEFGILGPLAVWEDGAELELGAAKQRAVLAILLLHAGETMSTERLVDALWDEKPPATAVKALQVYVSQLRKALGDGVVETRPLGYVVRVEDGALDLQRFERLLDEGRQLLAAGAPAEAGEVLRRALALWRGAPLADFRYEAFAHEEIVRLEALRLVALEHRLEADLAVGRHGEAIPELEALIRDYPLRERLRELLMLALYRSGRQADALAVMQEARATLRDELGLDPSQALQRLEKAILLQDPSLDAAPAAVPPEAAAHHVRPRSAEPASAPEVEVITRAQRKVVTVLFADVAGSTEFGESLDPEALRALLATYFEQMKAAAERHGGVVEKFIGDAVMAVFGVPAVHEDDALRALRAAMEMRDAIAELGIEGRIGVESGEVVVGTDERLVTGRAVTSAARLEQAAQPGEILVGEGTIRLAGEAATAERIEPLELKGKREPVPAWRLLSVSADAPARRFDSPFVGRERELGMLDEAWARVCTEERCELVTVLGVAGVGKSRLVSELVGRIDAAVAQGRCLSYGAGITYSPVVDVVAQLRPSMPNLEPAIPPPLRALLDDHGASSPDELAWAFRKFVEAAARQRPLMLVFDDIQWAEEALLDLIEHVAFVSSGAPILLVCMARPELLDRRPGWPGLIRLEPLTPQEAEQMISTLIGDRAPDAAMSQRIVAAADGNPLFVQELAAMLEESSDELIATPPTIQALLAARLDQLDPAERTVLEAAAVEGEVFHLDAVRAVTSDEPLTTQLTALVRNEFVRPYRPAFEGEDGFRFHHLLLRDATYDAIPKATRSGLHERYANWLEQRGDGLDALVGYHLEQAYRFGQELRRPNTELGARAGRFLRAAGRKAFGRTDLPAAISLFKRASALLPYDEAAKLQPELGEAFFDAGRFTEADDVLDSVIARAEADPVLESRVRVEQQFVRLHAESGGDIGEANRVASAALRVFEKHADDVGQCRAWSLRAWIEWNEGRVTRADEAWQRAAAHAQADGDERSLFEILTWRASAALYGPTPVRAAIETCTAILEQVRTNPVAVGVTTLPLAALHAMRGEFDHARALVGEANAILDDVGRMHSAAPLHEVLVETLAGNFARAENLMRPAYERLEQMGEKALLATTAAHLARTLYALERYGEADQFCSASESAAAAEDVVSQVIWRGTRAKILARQGRVDEAEALVREAVRQVSQTDQLTDHSATLLDLAEVLRLAERPNAANMAVLEAIDLYTQKGNTVSAGHARSLLAMVATT